MTDGHSFTFQLICRGLPAAALFCTFCASAWLSSRLQSLSSRLRRRSARVGFPLLGRQLQYLSASDLAFSAAELFLLLIELLAKRDILSGAPEAAFGWMCAGIDVGRSGGVYSSMFVEAHLSVTFAASIFGFTRPVYHLRKALVLTSPLAVLLAISEVYVYEMNHFTQGVGCTARGTRGHGNRDSFFYTVAVTSMTICFTAYFFSAVKVRRAGEAVRLRAFSRIHGYVLTAVFCIAPNLAYRLVYFVYYHDMKRSLVGEVFVFTLFDIKGACNTMLYVILSTRALRMFRRCNGTATGASRTAQPSGVEVSSVANLSKGPAQFASNRSGVSTDSRGLVVNFVREPEIIDVVADQQQALLRAEEEIRMLGAFEDEERDIFFDAYSF